jgi:hypothetical protein
LQVGSNLDLYEAALGPDNNMHRAIAEARSHTPVDHFGIWEPPDDALHDLILLRAGHLPDDPGTGDVLHGGQRHRPIALQLLDDCPCCLISVRRLQPQQD